MLVLRCTNPCTSEERSEMPRLAADQPLRCERTSGNTYTSVSTHQISHLKKE